MNARPMRRLLVTTCVAMCAASLPACSSDKPGGGNGKDATSGDMKSPGDDSSTQDGDQADSGQNGLDAVVANDAWIPFDSGVIDGGADPNNPNNMMIDSDCDGLS